MSKRFVWTRVFAFAIGLTMAAGTPQAQDDETEEGSVQIRPRPSQDADLASRSLLLGVSNTGKHIVAVGDRGNIVVSNDGVNWAQVETPVRATLTAVDFIDDDHGWAVGHDAVILSTSDGGKSWQLQNFQPEVEMPLLDVMFSDTQNGVAIGAYGLMMETSDGGVSWEEKDAPEIREEELHLNNIVRLGNGDILIVGESGMMGISSDGDQWERLESPYEGSLYGAVARGESGALIFGLRGNVYTTDDVRSGEWKKITTGTVASFFGGTSLPSGSVALVGLAGMVAVISPTGQVSRTEVEATSGVTGSGTLSNAVPWRGGVLAVGELGASSVGL